MIAIVTALPEELAPLLRRAKIDRVVRIGRRRAHAGSMNGTPVVLMATGDGVAQAEENLARLLQRFEISSIIGAGVAGAIASDLKPGDVIVADEESGGETPALHGARRAKIATVDRIIGSAAEKRAIDAEAIDTESAGWQRAALHARVPLKNVRVIFDAADEEIPAFVSGDGTIDRAAIVRHALRHPKTIPVLLQMRRRMHDVCETLANAIARSVASPEQRLNELLRDTSRTFALCVPLLNDGVYEQVALAYLLFRIADTFEDASHLSVEDRVTMLDQFCTLLGNPDPDEARRFSESWYAKRPSSHAGYMRLIADVPLVVSACNALPAGASAIIRQHVIRSAKGMAHFVAMTKEGKLQLADMQQLRAYCYAVAGIVGEMLTELFLLSAPQLQSVASQLRSRAAVFGEALQLVNILKDSLADLSEGRIYIPPGTDRAAVIALARADLESAAEYTLALQAAGAPGGMVAFAALPVELARAALNLLETSAPGVKVSRPEVFRIARRIKQSVARGEPPLTLRSHNAPPPGRMRSMLSLLFGMR